MNTKIEFCEWRGFCFNREKFSFLRKLKEGTYLSVYTNDQGLFKLAKFNEAVTSDWIYCGYAEVHNDLIILPDCIITSIGKKYCYHTIFMTKEDVMLSVKSVKDSVFIDTNESLKAISA